jgi:hypothetical protein
MSHLRAVDRRGAQWCQHSDRSDCIVSTGNEADVADWNVASPPGRHNQRSSVVRFASIVGLCICENWASVVDLNVASISGKRR